MEITCETTIPEEMVKQYLEIYRVAFEPLEELSPCRQSLTDDEFREEMALESVLKFVLWDDGGAAVAMAFVATDLSAVPWVSPRYFEKRFPELYARKAIYYFGSLLVHPDYQGGPWVKRLLERLVSHVVDDEGVAAFDCCDYNVEVIKLPEMIRAIADEQTFLEVQELGPQHYFAYLAHGRRP